MNQQENRFALTVSTAEAVEVVDKNDKPLCVLSLPDASRQVLRHRTVLVLVYDAKGRLFLQKRSKTKTLYPGRWDLSATGHVKASESREDAAIRELFEELGIRAAGLKRIQDVEASPSTGHTFVTLFSAGRIATSMRTNPEEIADGMFVDREELDLLACNFRDQLTPGLVFFWERGLLFPKSSAKANDSSGQTESPDSEDFADM